MKVTLELSEETLAGIWANSWEDKETAGMKARLEGVLAAKASEYYGAFPKARAGVLERYAKSPHRISDGAEEAVSIFLRSVDTSHPSLKSPLTADDLRLLRDTYPEPSPPASDV